MAAHRKGKPLVIETPHFGSVIKRRELQPQELAPKAFAPEQSLRLILQGNLGHMSALNGLVPEGRYKKIVAGQADYLVLSCSDARGHRLDSEDDERVGVFLRIAGNAVGEKGSPDRTSLEKALSLVKRGGDVIIESHVHCGAVTEYEKWFRGGMKPTGSKDMDVLLHELGGIYPTINASFQLAKVRGAMGLGSRAAAVHYNWETGTISDISSSSPSIQQIVGKWAGIHSEADKDGTLAKRLEKQAPHAIAICTADLPFSVATITHARQNEIFATTGSEAGLDPSAKASALYAASHLGPKHIVFMAPGKAGDDQKIMKMFAAWEHGLRGIKSGGKQVFADALNSGGMEISCLRYDLTNGMLVRIA